MELKGEKDADNNRDASMLRRALGAEDGKRKRSASDDIAGGERVGGARTGDESMDEVGDRDVVNGSGDADGRDAEELARRKKKWTRLLLRELYDLGFRASAERLEREAGVQLRSDAMKALEAAVRARQWDAALALVSGTASTSRAGSSSTHLRMKSVEAAREASLLLLRRKYIDCLVERDLRSALKTFQTEILPAHVLTEDETKQLAVLLMCTEAGQVERLAQAPWKEADLLASIEQLVSPEEIIPEGALQRLVRSDLEVEEQAAPMELQAPVIGECTDVLMQHKGDVWELAFSPNGKFMASAARDGTIIVWQLAFETRGAAVDRSLQASAFRTVHSLEEHVECLAWAPDSRRLLCCGSKSNIIQLWSVETGTFDHRYEHPAEGVMTVKWLPNGNQFISGSADKMLILWNATDGSITYQWSGRRILDTAVHPRDGRVFVLMPNNDIYVYDPARRTDELFYEGDHLVSCICLSTSGRYLLVNLVRHEEIVCLDIESEAVVARYRGLREQRYVLRPCFAGYQDEVVVCGSEDGKLLVWSRENGKLLTTLEGHSSVVNAVRSHPVHRNILASASDDETIRVWHLKQLQE